MKPFIPRRLEQIAFGLLLSGMMSFIVSGISTALAVGMSPRLPLAWISAWPPSWAVAFPAVLVVAPSFVAYCIASSCRPERRRAIPSVIQ